MKKLFLFNLKALLAIALVICWAPMSGQNGKSDKSIFTATMVEMNWQQVKDAANTKAIVLLPVSIVEEHGPHMDLSPDIYLSVIGCRMVKAELAKQGVNAIIAPPYYWGISKTTDMFPGTFTVRPETFSAIMFDIIGCLKAWGFKDIFVGNLHGDPLHRATIASSMKAIRDSLKINVYDISELPHQESEKKPDSEPGTKMYEPDYHAGAYETKIIWDFFPDKVDVVKAESLRPQNTFLPLGYAGDPANFKKAVGKEEIQEIADEAAQTIIDFMKNSTRQ